MQKTRPRLARKHNIASEVGQTLQDAFFFRTRSICEASARQHQARCSAQTGRCKLVCASCSTQVALCKLLCASCSAQVAPASWSLQVAPCKLLCANCAPCKLLCASCSAQVALCKLLCVSCSAQVALGKALCSAQVASLASCSRQGALRKLVGASWSAQVALCKLLCASCFKMQVASCDARPRTREESNPQPAGPGAGARTTRQLPRTTKDAKNLEFLHLDHADSRRGLREHRRNRKKPRVFAPRPRRFPQRVARAPQKSQKNMGFCTSTTPIPAEGRASTAEIAKNHGFLHPRRVARGTAEIAKKKHGFLHLDHAAPRRGSRGHVGNRKKPLVFAPRPRRSPQRVDFRVETSALPRRPNKRF